MKSIKFLAALAIPAMFAACTNEEIVMDTPQQMQDVEGAELIANGMSLNTMSSRLSAGGDWEIGDQLALGWSVVDGYSSVQSATADLDYLSWELYANHLFEVDENGAFVTKGNVYKGWHFAYWPFSYMEKIGQKVFNINPDQTEEWSKDRMANKLQLSAQHFLTREDLDENYQLNNPNKQFKTVRVLNEIAVRTTPNGGFVDNTVLNALKFEKMEITTNTGVFTQYAKLYPAGLPAAVNENGTSIYTARKEEDKVYNEEKTLEAVKNAINNALKPSNATGKDASLTTKITTDVSKANLVTGTSTTLRAFALPVEKQTALTVNSIVIRVENGYFTIKNVKDAEEGSLAAHNNEQLKTLADAYLEDGIMTALGGGVVGLTVNLYPEIFTPDFSDIDNYEEWKKAVDLVDALGTYNENNVPVFTITGDIEVTDNAIDMPTDCGIVVKGNYNIVTKTTMSTWPENLNASAVDVVIDSNVTLPVPSVVNAQSITVNEGKKLTLKGGKTTTEVLNVPVVNNGTIVVNKNAEVENVDNNSRIEVVYGSYVTTTENVGIIAYVLTGNDKAYQLNYLMDTENNTAGFASVNTLVVNSGKTLDLGLTDPAGTGLDDPYNPTTGSEAIELNDLSAINVEMNGGDIVGVQGGKLNVGHVSVLKGTNTITDVIPASIEVSAKATLNIDATKDVYGVKYALDMKATTINNNGTLNVETNTHIDTLVNTGTVDATGYKLHSYTVSDTNAGKTIGDVKVCDETIEAPVVDEKAEAVMTAFVNYQNQYNRTSLEELLTDMNKTTTQAINDGWLIGKLYTALSDWLVENGYDALSTETPAVEKWQFTVFQNTTGKTFEF